MWPLKWIFTFALLVFGLARSTAPDRHGAGALGLVVMMAIALGLLVRDAVLLRRREESEFSRRARIANAGLLVIGVVLGGMRLERGLGPAEPEVDDHGN